MDFEALTNQHKDAVYRQMLRVCGNREDAEDVLIEALLRAWVQIDRLENPAAFRAWLAQIGRRVCYRVRRREALLPIEEMPEFEAAASGADPEQQSAADQMKAIVRDALAALPELYRQVYERRDLEERSGEEVAAEMGISLAAMKSRLHRARALLRAELDKRLDLHGKGKKDKCHGSDR